MFRLRFVLIITMLFAACIQVNAQLNWGWAASAGTGPYQNAYSLGQSMDIDQYGNTYVAAYITSPAKVGNLALTSYGMNDIVIIKYDPSGNPVWARTAGGPYSDGAKCIKVSPEGFIYVLGYYYQSATFGTQNLTTTQNGFFVAKLDPNGNFIWVNGGNSIANNTWEPSSALNIDNAGNIYIAGFCDDGAQLIGTTYVSPIPWTKAFFIEQLDTAGNYVNVYYHVGGDFNGNGGVDLCFDSGNNLYYTFQRIRIDTIINGPNSSTNYNNLVLGSISNSFVPVWEREYGDTANYVWGAVPHSMTIDANGFLYVTGFYYKTLWLQPGPAGNGGFTGKFDPVNGNVISARQWNTNNNSIPVPYGADYDSSGHVLYCGNFCGTVDFGGIFSSPIASWYDCDNFVVSYDTSGQLNWVLRYGYMSFDGIRGSNYTNGRYGLTGSFKDSLTFGNHTIYQDTTTSGCDYIFTAVTNSESVDAVSLPGLNAHILIYPNPSSDFLYVELPYQDITVEIFSADGKLVSSIYNYTGQPIDIRMLSAGNYFITVRNDYFAFSKLFIKK